MLRVGNQQFKVYKFTTYEEDYFFSCLPRSDEYIRIFSAGKGVDRGYC